MVQILADTSILIENLEIKKDLNFFIENEVYISVLTEYEFLYGRRKYKEEKKLLAKLVEILPLTNSIILKAIEIKKALQKKGIPISEIDYFIAATSLVYDLELWTMDKDFLKVKREFPDLKLKIL